VPDFQVKKTNQIHVKKCNRCSQNTMPVGYTGNIVLLVMSMFVCFTPLQTELNVCSKKARTLCFSLNTTIFEYFSCVCPGLISGFVTYFYTPNHFQQVGDQDLVCLSDCPSVAQVCVARYSERDRAIKLSMNTSQHVNSHLEIFALILNIFRTNVLGHWDVLWTQNGI